MFFWRILKQREFKECDYPKHDPVSASNPADIYEDNENSVKLSYP